MTEIAMPRLSDSMEQGIVLEWLVANGAEVVVGDELAEIETDKATMTYQSEVVGTLQIVVPEGTRVNVGDVIATVGAPAAAQRLASESALQSQVPSVAAVNGIGNDKSATVTADPDAPATPVARRLAGIHGVELSLLEGTGPRGRITKSDVLTAAGLEPLAASASLPPARVATLARSPVSAPNGSGQTEELSRLQQVVARRMADAKSTIPHFQVQTEVDMGAALALRAELTAFAAGEAPPSVNDLIVKACAAALRDHPRVNGSYKDEHFELHERVNVGVAVAADGALVVPTVFDADAKSLGQIARDIRTLVARVRDRQVTPLELSGATFTVSNLGMFGMTAITPVINPPQAAMLGVGAIRDTLARDADAQIVDRQLLTLTLSCDHRILYGADAAWFLADVKAFLEAPLRVAFE